jgi:hypothetical protein
MDHRAAPPAIKKLMADGGPVQLSLSGQQDLAEIPARTSRRAAHRLPQPGAGRRPRRKREDLLQATEKLLAPIIARVQARRLAGAEPVGVEAGKAISKYKTSKHFDVAITDTSPAAARKQDRIDAEAALDGFYVLRTPVAARQLDAPA